MNEFLLTPTPIAVYHLQPFTSVVLSPFPYLFPPSHVHPDAFPLYPFVPL